MPDAIRDFRIDIPQPQLDDLARRLAHTRFPDAETTGDWNQGVPLDYMRELVDYWRERYDWRRAEALLNGFEHFLTEIDGLDIHFIHARSPHPEARPLLITHGWPGSVLEFHKVIGPLTDPVSHGGMASDAFHVVCPSLPGFGFSGKPTTPGWSIERIAGAWSQLMERLGYEAWLAQGGDWGALIMQTPAFDAIEACRGMHINFAIYAPDPDTMDALTDAEQAALASLKHYQDIDSGYARIQATRPQTLGYGLADSPAGQAAWIIEKFWSWMDCDGHPENVVSRDELLDNVMLYWLTDSAASSARIYYESMSRVGLNPVTRPTGISVFPGEFMRPSKRWAEQRFEHLVHYNVLQRGGHFAAFERPELYLAEVRAALAQMPL